LDLGLLLQGLPQPNHPDILVGYDTSDDAGVFRIRPDLALVQTLDIITPVTDDPFLYGQVAAANALSDVYAMGGRPVTALNICCFPFAKLPAPVLEEIVRGGLDKIREGGAVLLGGHTVRDDELKYGLSVSGIVDPGQVVTNAGARTGDSLILTKPIGSGALINAVRSGSISEAIIQEPLQIMAQLNRTACEAMVRVGVDACTDITGFGLAGHALEIARASGVRLLLSMSTVPIYSAALEVVCEKLKRQTSDPKAMDVKTCRISPDVPASKRALLFDPQTSGGLLIAVSRDKTESLLSELLAAGVRHAAVIGEVVSGDPPGIDVS
jgi:selenide,water dikinase